MSESIESQMQNLALERYGTSDLTELAPGLLEILEKEVENGNAMGNT